MAIKIGLFAKVLVDVPGLPPLDYRIPDDLLVAVGDLVVVPLGSRRVVGVVATLANAADCEDKRLKCISAVLHATAPLNAEWLALTKFAAIYYLRGWGEAALPAIPTALRRMPTPQQEKRIAKIRDAMPIPDTSQESAIEVPTLNAEQRAAVSAVLSMSGFQAWLLFGVTGSGKTEVYLHLIKSILERDPESQVLLLVPEINLTPQLVGRVKRRFPHEAVAALNSEYTDNQRGWGLRKGVQEFWLVLVWRFSPSSESWRLFLLMKNTIFPIRLVMGCATALEILLFGGHRNLNAQSYWDRLHPRLKSGGARPTRKTGGYKLLSLTHRAVNRAELPEVKLISPPIKGSTRMVSDAAATAIEACLTSGRQVLVFLNRRGYAPVLSCPACGWVSACPHCSVFMVYHKREKALICHHCGARHSVPEACPSCGNVDILPRGTGTERIEEELGLLFPERTVLRIDRDSAAKKHAAEEAFQKVHRGEVDILVGTQMVAKGHDFQRVGLVVVLNPDAQILSPSVRAKERLFFTLMQVAGRAGRAGDRGEVLIQTRFPEEPLFAALAAQDYPMFADETLEDRRESGCVPFVYQALLTVEAEHLSEAMSFLEQAATIASQLAPPEVFIYDPVPMALVKVMNRERAQLLVESSVRPILHRFLTVWNQALKIVPRSSSASVCLEVDPSET